MLTNNEKLDAIIMCVLVISVTVLLSWRVYDYYQSKPIPTGKSLTVTVAQGEGLNDVVFRAYRYIGVDCDVYLMSEDIENLNKEIDVYHLHPGMQVRIPIYIPRKYIDKFNEVFHTNLPNEGVINISDAPRGEELLKFLKLEIPLCEYCVENPIPWGRCGEECKSEEFATED